MRLRLLLISVALAICAFSAEAASERPPGGIWKNAVPAHIQGEFAKEDVMGLAAGVHIQTDCSINWIDPDSGKRYCFASGTSLVYFQMAPKANLAKAQAFARAEAARSAGSTTK